MRLQSTHFQAFCTISVHVYRLGTRSNWSTHTCTSFATSLQLLHYIQIIMQCSLPSLPLKYIYYPRDLGNSTCYMHWYPCSVCGWASQPLPTSLQILGLPSHCMLVCIPQSFSCLAIEVYYPRDFGSYILALIPMQCVWVSFPTTSIAQSACSLESSCSYCTCLVSCVYSSIISLSPSLYARSFCQSRKGSCRTLTSMRSGHEISTKLPPK